MYICSNTILRQSLKKGTLKLLTESGVLAVVSGSLAEGQAAEETSEGGEDVGLDRLQVLLRLLLLFLVVLGPALVVLPQDYDPLFDLMAILGGDRGHVTGGTSCLVLQDNVSV